MEPGGDIQEKVFMDYMADVYVTHDALDELLKKRAEAGWIIHRILEVKHWDTAAVTVIWEASSALKPEIPSPLEETLPGKCVDSHRFSTKVMDKAGVGFKLSRTCDDCGTTFHEMASYKPPADDGEVPVIPDLPFRERCE